MIKSKKAHQVGTALLIVLLIAGFFAFGLYTGSNSTQTEKAVMQLQKSKITGMASNDDIGGNEESLDGLNEITGEATIIVSDGKENRGLARITGEQVIDLPRPATEPATKTVKPSQKMYNVEIRTTSGVQTVPIQASSSDEAKKEVQKKYNIPMTSIGKATEAGGATTVRGEYKIVGTTPDGKTFVSNGGVPSVVPKDISPADFVKYLNDYGTFLKDNKLTDSKSSKEAYIKTLDFEGTTQVAKDARIVLGIPETPTATTAKSAAKEVIKLTNADGNTIYKYGNEYYKTEDEAKAVQAFEKAHPGARDLGYKILEIDPVGTNDRIGETIYIVGNKFVLASTPKDGKYEGPAVKDEGIGKTKYQVQYDIKNGKAAAKNIRVEDKSVEINDNVLRQLKALGGEENPLAVNEKGELIHTKTATKSEGKDEKATTTETKVASILNAKGLAVSVMEEKITNNEGKLIEHEITTRTFKQDVKGRPIEDLRTEKKFEKDKDGIVTQDFTAITIEAATGKPIRILIGEGGNEYKITYEKDGVKINGKPFDAEIAKLDDPDLKNKLLLFRNLENQYSSRQIFKQFESVLTDYAGLGYYATLFFNKEDLGKWRESVDQAFATLYLGTEYWESAICSVHVDRDNEGVAYIDTKLGLASVAAHIEASRSENILGPGKEDSITGIVKPTSEFLYKITFNVKNGDWKNDPKALERMRFNIILKGQKNAKLFRNDIELSKGNQFGHAGRSAIVQYSNSFYDKICIQFDDTPVSWTIGNELCNTIMGPSGPTSIGASGSGQQPAQSQETGEGNVNDI